MSSAAYQAASLLSGLPRSPAAFASLSSAPPAVPSRLVGEINGLLSPRGFPPLSRFPAGRHDLSEDHTERFHLPLPPPADCRPRRAAMCYRPPLGRMSDTPLALRASLHGFRIHHADG